MTGSSQHLQPGSKCDTHSLRVTNTNKTAKLVSSTCITVQQM